MTMVNKHNDYGGMLTPLTAYLRINVEGGIG